LIYAYIKVISNYQGWYILFHDDVSAPKAKILDSTLVQGHRLVINVKSASTRKADDGITTSPEAKANWRYLTITKKNKPVAPSLRPKPLVEKSNDRRRQRSYSTSDSDTNMEVAMPVLNQRIRSASPSSDSEPEEGIPLASIKVKPVVAVALDKHTVAAVPDGKVPPVKLEGDEDPVKANKKRAAKPKASNKTKKARILSPDPMVEIGPPVTPEVAEIKLEDLAAVALVPKPAKVAKPKAVKVSKPKKLAKTELEKFMETGVVEDEEDAYWLGQAIVSSHEGLAPDLSDVESEDEDAKIKEDHPLFHTSGSWRAEGVKKVPQIAKPQYLPERNRAVVSKDDATALTSGRTARVTGRRLAHDMETTRKTASTATVESDMFAFNQLRIRKKQLRFSRSPIEGYGLYAMETIHPGEMVCEYVGEICRSAVADIREQRYMKQGIGSSYLFRIDADMVCDATFKGTVRWVLERLAHMEKLTPSRLINHSCDPSASAKIISINGQSKVSN
jgi:histone-lysine N-methyltransferase SETD1